MSVSCQYLVCTERRVTLLSYCFIHHCCPSCVLLHASLLCNMKDTRQNLQRLQAVYSEWNSEPTCYCTHTHTHVVFMHKLFCRPTSSQLAHWHSKDVSCVADLLHDVASCIHACIHSIFSPVLLPPPACVRSCFGGFRVLPLDRPTFHSTTVYRPAHTPCQVAIHGVVQQRVMFLCCAQVKCLQPHRFAIC